MAPDSFFPPEDPEPQLAESSMGSSLCCLVCTRLLERPLELTCGAIICLRCCQDWIQLHPYRSLGCPCCYSSLESIHIRQPPSLIVSLVKGLLVHCVRRCGKLVYIDHYHKHINGQCKSHYHQLVDSPSKLTIKEVLSRPTTAPATPSERRVAEHLVRKIIDQGSSSSSTDGIVKVPTRGQVSYTNHTQINSNNKKL